MRLTVGLVIAGACLLAIIAAWRLMASYQVATAQNDKMAALFVANPSNDVVLSVRVGIAASLTG
jgi:hypothetical protein